MLVSRKHTSKLSRKIKHHSAMSVQKRKRVNEIMRKRKRTRRRRSTGQNYRGFSYKELNIAASGTK